MASPILITTGAALAANDFIDWNQLGPASTFVSSPAAVTSNGGLDATVSEAGTFGRYDQTGGSCASGGWVGNFAPCDKVLWTGNVISGAMSIVFADAIAGAGAQIQTYNYGGFTARITAYDSSNNLLGSYTEVGTSNNAGDNSAIFLGVLDTIADIKRIDYDITAGQPNNFATNRLEINAPATVPEPASMVLLGTGIGAVFVRRRRSTNG